MKNYRCSVCGYIHKGEEAPDVCPNCGALTEKFVEVTESNDGIHINFAQKASYGKEVAVIPFFEDYESLAPFMYNLPAGQEVKLHKHQTTDELFYIIKGKFQFTVGEEKFVASEGDIIQGKMNTAHAFKNISDEAGIFLSVKAPKPVDLVMI